MKNKTKQVLELFRNNRKIVENYFFMTFLQVLNSFFYLIVYPYLIRTLGIESYGLYVFATSISMYFVTFVNFGFEMPALNSIVLNQNDKKGLSHILSCVFTAKLYLEFFSLLIFVFLVVSLPVLNKNWIIYVLCFSNTLTGIFFPIWYFQGIQNMRIVTWIQLSFKIVSLLFILILVKSEDDLAVFVLIVNATNIGGALVAFYIIKYVHKIRISLIRFSEIKPLFKDAMPFFWTVAAGTIKGQSVALITGSFFNMSDVAIYDLAYKIISIPSTLLTSINTALFPKMILNLKKEKVKSIINYESLVGLLVIVFILLFGKLIIEFLGGNKMMAAYPMAVILSITVYAWLVVGAYINFVFIPNKLFYVITKNQSIALASFFVYFLIGIVFFKNVLVLVVALSFSALTEVLFCRQVVKNKNLL